MSIFGPAYPETRPVVVSLKSDPHRGFRGVYWRRTRDYVVLKGAELVQGAEVKQVDGDVVIDRANIDYIQVLGAE